MPLQSLSIKNYRCFANLELTDLPPLTVFVGANGSGKSTLFDLFAFLRESMRDDVTTALARRGGFDALRTLGSTAPIEITMVMLLRGEHGAAVPSSIPPLFPDGDSDELLLTYSAAIDQVGAEAYIAHESLRYAKRGEPDAARRDAFTIDRAKAQADEQAPPRDAIDMLPPNRLALDQPFAAVFVTHRRDDGDTADGAEDHDGGEGRSASLDPGREMFRVTLLVEQFRDFLRTAYVSNLEVEAAKRPSEVSAERNLSQRGDNLAQVVRRRMQEEPDSFKAAVAAARRMIPGLAGADVEQMSDGRVLLKIADDSYSEPFSALHVSDGTIKALAYLMLLHEPERHGLLCIEEPENYLYPTIVGDLLEELRVYAANGASQVLVATHSPDLVDAAAPEEVFWFVKRGGLSAAYRVSDHEQLVAQHGLGDHLGRMWQFGAFDGVHPG